MSARIDIVNIALTWLGAHEITSLEDDSNEARIMKTNYYLARDATLEEAEWSFAIRRWKPAQSSTSPISGASYYFPIPSDIIRVLRVDNSSGATGLGATYGTGADPHSIDRAPQADHRVEGSMILTDESSIYCKGIRRIEDEGIYSPLFAHAFAAHLAMLCAYTITESDGKFNAMSAIYQLKIKEAKSRDGLQGTSKRIRNTSTTRVR
jgi:hypothetical protein